MPIELEDGTLRISVGYSIKKPGAAQYTSEDAHSGFSVEVPIPDDIKNTKELLDQAQQIQAELHTQAKLHAFAQLDLGYETTEGGVLVPVFDGASRTASAPRRQPQRQQQSQSSGGYNGQQRTPSKSAGRDLPTFFDANGVEWEDCRPLKDDGTFKPNAADFRSISGDRKQSKWLYSKSGDLNGATAEWLDAAGVGY